MPGTPRKLNAIIGRLANPAWVCFVWFGVTAGAALLAVTAIFAADAATRPVSLDIARTLFERLVGVEFVFLVTLLLLIRSTGRATKLWAVSGLLALIMIGQAAWLIPELSARTDMILSGNEPPPSIAHAAYSSSTLIKLGLLLFVGFGQLPSESRQSAVRGSEEQTQ